MTDAIFRSKSNTYEGEYNCVMRSPQNEMAPGLHYHDFYEFVIYLGNGGVFRIEDGEYLVKRGDIVLIDMFTPHTLIYNKNSFYERFSISVDPALLISFSTPNSNLLDVFHKSCERAPIHHVEDEHFQKYLTLLDQYRTLKLNQGQDILIKALIHQLMAFAYSDCYTEQRYDETDSRHVSIIAQIINYINEHLGEELSLDQLSREVNYSEYYVCRLFKKMTGKTLTTYIQEKRIEMAAQMLRNNEPVSKAAERVGFNNYSYFYKTFKKLMGCSPAEYRESSRSSPILS